MMRSLVVVAALLVTALAGCAETAPIQELPSGRIDGAVVDQGLAPHGGATVRLMELEREDITNDLGGFTFHNVPPGFYTLRVVVDGKEDHEVAAVGDDIARVILQVERVVPELPHVTTLRHSGELRLGLPGEICNSCSWSTPLRDRPDHIRLEADWDAGDLQAAGGSPMLVVELRDSAGRELASVEGPSPLTTTIRGAGDVPARELEVRVRVHPDSDTPAPGAEVHTKLELFYDQGPGY